MFIRATYFREKKTVHYFDENGEETLYIGGSFAWRTNNPGNMTKPGQRIVSTSIGYAQRISESQGLFLIFPDRATGDAERIRLLKEVYGKSSIAAMIEKYAPRKDKGNDTDGYIAIVTKATGADKSTRLDQLSKDQFDKLAAAMAKHEGWIPGKIVPLGKPMTADLRDKLQQPIAEQPIAVKGSDKDVTVKTDTNGALPLLYTKLFNDSLSLYLDNVGDKIGDIGSGDGEFSCTFVAPYLTLTSSADIHETKEKQVQRIHIVRPRETLGSIAGQYPGVTVDSLVAANKLKDPDKIFARQHLRIPSMPALQSTDARAKTGSPAPIAPNVRPKSEASPETKPAPAAAPPKSPLGDLTKPTSKARPASASTAQVDRQRTDKNHPITVLSSPQLAVSGPEWCKQFRGDDTINGLSPTFRPKVEKFLAALRSGGVSVKINSVFRPVERSYLMYWAFMICRGQDVTKVIPQPGVAIDWAHRDAAGNPDIQKARTAAAKMCEKFDIKPASPSQAVGYPGKSNHNKGLALDMNLDNFVGKVVKDADGNDTKVASFHTLTVIGKTYGVKYFTKEKMHWSWNGH